MAPTSSRPVSPPLPPDLPLNDVRWMRRHPDRWPMDLTFKKNAVNEKMWCEWCQCEQCNNMEYEVTVMNSAGYIAFLGRVSKKFHNNLISDVPSDDVLLTPLKYVQKICFLHYEHYAKLFGYAWGGGQYSEIPECFTAKMRMTFRQPAKNLTEWVKKPMLYLITDGATCNHAIDLTTGTVLGKRGP